METEAEDQDIMRECNVRNQKQTTHSTDCYRHCPPKLGPRKNKGPVPCQALLDIFIGESLLVLSSCDCLHPWASTRSFPSQFQPHSRAEEGAGTWTCLHFPGGQQQWVTGAHCPFHIPACTLGWRPRALGSPRALSEHSTKRQWSSVQGTWNAPFHSCNFLHFLILTSAILEEAIDRSRCDGFFQSLVMAGRVYAKSQAGNHFRTLTSVWARPSWPLLGPPIFMCKSWAYFSVTNE